MHISKAQKVKAMSTSMRKYAEETFKGRVTNTLVSEHGASQVEFIQRLLLTNAHVIHHSVSESSKMYQDSL